MQMVTDRDISVPTEIDDPKGTSYIDRQSVFEV